MLAIEHSRSIARDIDAHMGQCWRNALLALLSCDTLREGYYVEGYAILECGISIEHGWVELEKDGETLVVDPTLVLSETLDSTYIAGVRYSYAQARRLIGKRLPHVYHDQHGGMSIPAYKAAMIASYRAFPDVQKVLSMF